MKKTTKLLSLFSALILCLSLTTISKTYAQDIDPEEGGVAICKLKGGKTKVRGKFKAVENFILLNDFNKELEISIEGENETRKGERDLFTDIFVGNVDSDDFVPRRLLKTDAEAELEVELEEGNNEFVLLSINEDEDGFPVTSPVKLFITKIKGETVSGIAQATYPRTVTIPLDSPDIDLIDSEAEFSEIELQDATENGQVKLTCKFKNVPFTLIEN